MKSYECALIQCDWYFMNWLGHRHTQNEDHVNKDKGKRWPCKSKEERYQNKMNPAEILTWDF